MDGRLIHRGELGSSISLTLDEGLLEELADLNLQEVVESTEYIAGLMDGEGTITILKKGKGFSPRVSFPQSHLGLVSLFSEMAGVGNVYLQRANGCHVWVCSKRDDVDSFLQRIEPHLVIKQRHAQLVREFISLRRASKYGEGYNGRQSEIVDEVRRLNTKASKRT